MKPAAGWLSISLGALESTLQGRSSQKNEKEPIMRAHLTIDELYSLFLDDVVPNDSITTHLATCAACQAESSALRELANDLAIAQASAPSVDALSRYRSLFSHVQQQPVSAQLRRLAVQIRAVLTWDSRRQGVQQGVRSGTATTYRQIYTAAEVEIELMVEHNGRGRRVEGDLIAGKAGGHNEATLIEFIAAGERSLYATETDAHGLFYFDDVAPGTYRMVATRAESTAIEIESLEIA